MARGIAQAYHGTDTSILISTLIGTTLRLPKIEVVLKIEPASLLTASPKRASTSTMASGKLLTGEPSLRINLICPGVIITSGSD
jgi:hypothetical protein